MFLIVRSAKGNRQQTIDESCGQNHGVRSGALKFSCLWLLSSEEEKASIKKELDHARKSGYVRVRIDGIIYDLSEEIKLEKK